MQEAGDDPCENPNGQNMAFSSEGNHPAAEKNSQG